MLFVLDLNVSSVAATILKCVWNGNFCPVAMETSLHTPALTAKVAPLFFSPSHLPSSFCVSCSSLSLWSVSETKRSKWSQDSAPSKRAGHWHLSKCSVKTIWIVIRGFRPSVLASNNVSLSLCLSGAVPAGLLRLLQLQAGPAEPRDLPQLAVCQRRRRACRSARHSQLRVYQLPGWVTPEESDVRGWISSPVGLGRLTFC